MDARKITKIYAEISSGSCEGWCYKKVIEQDGLTTPSFLSCKRECFDTIGLLPDDIVILVQDANILKSDLSMNIVGIYHTDANDRLMSKEKDMADDYLRINNIESARETYQHYVCQLENNSLEELKDKLVQELHTDQEILIYGIEDWGKRFLGC